MTEPPTHDPQTGEVGPHTIPLPQPNGLTLHVPLHILWGERFVAAVNAAKTTDELAEWDQANTKMLQEIAQESPRTYERIRANVLTAREKLMQHDPQTDIGLDDDYNQEARYDEPPINGAMPGVPRFLDRRPANGATC